MCEFWIRGTGHGDLESPRHSLPPNTTCLYHLQVSESQHFSRFLCLKPSINLCSGNRIHLPTLRSISFTKANGYNFASTIEIQSMDFCFEIQFISKILELR